MKSTSRADSIPAAFSQVQEAKKKKVVLAIAIYQLIRVKGTTKHTLRTATTGTSLARDGRVLTGGALTGALASWTGAY